MQSQPFIYILIVLGATTPQDKLTKTDLNGVKSSDILSILNDYCMKQSDQTPV